MRMHNFSREQRRELLRLGLCPEQIEELRPVIGRVRLWIRPPAARNKTRAHLAEVSKYAKALERKLSALESMAASDYRLAEELMQERYYARDPFPQDEAATMLMAFLPRLRTILEAADYSLANLEPSGPARNRTGNPAPVRRIWEALVTGWGKAHSPVGCVTFVNVRKIGTGDPAADAEDENAAVAEMLADAKTMPAGPPYPLELMPSGGAFKDVVRLLYEVAGYAKGEPKRAIENFVAEYRANCEGAVAALERGMAEAQGALRE